MRCEPLKMECTLEMIGVRSGQFSSSLRFYFLQLLIIDAFLVTSGTNTLVWKRWNLTSANHEWPCSRSAAAVLLDQSLGNVWVFGGHKVMDSTEEFQKNLTDNVMLSDFWKLNLTTLVWTKIEENDPWPSQREFAVAGGAPHGLILGGGIDSGGVQRSDIWEYEFVTSEWRIKLNDKRILGNKIRFWTNYTDLFGLIMHNSSTLYLTHYNISKGNWQKNTIQNSSHKLPSKLEPDITNLTHYPLWPSEEDLAIIYAPIKNFKFFIDAERKVAHQPCILWILTNLYEWKPFVNDCEMYKTCRSILPSSVRTVEAIKGLPSCRSRSATWTDGEGNLWMFGGVNRSGVGEQDLWRFNRRSRSWDLVNVQCRKTENGESSRDCQHAPWNTFDAMAWQANGTLYLLGGQPIRDFNSSPFLDHLWTIDISSFSNRPTLPIAPVGIFLITVSGLVILSLMTCGLIVFAKCSSPLAPRIRPPRRTYDRVQYSPVSTTDT